MTTKEDLDIFQEKWKNGVKGFKKRIDYPDFVKKCEELAKKHSNEIIVDKNTKYEEVTEK